MTSRNLRGTSPNQSYEWLGDVSLATWSGHWLLGGLAAAILVAIFVAAFFIKYTATTKYPGVILPVTGLVVIKSPAAGTLTRLSVHDGSVVNAGETLAVISSERTRPTGDQIRKNQSEILENARQRYSNLSSEVGAANRVRQASIDRLEHQTAGLRRELSEATTELDLLNKRTTMSIRQLKLMDDLSKQGFYSENALLQKQAEVADSQGKEASLRRTIAGIERQLNDSVDGARVLNSESARDAVKIQSTALSVGAEIIQAEAARDSVVVAPIAGTVAALRVSEGAHVDDEALMAVLPKDPKLIVEFWVNGSELEDVRPGSSVTFFLPAPKGDRTTSFEGSILTVSGVASIPETASSVAPEKRHSDGKFRATAQFLDQGIRDARLAPGTTVDLRVRQQRRSIAGWLVKGISDQ